MNAATAQRATLGVGVGSLVLGVALLLFPERLGAGNDRRAAHVIAAADLALVPGLLVGRPRWPWLVARGLLNLAIAARLSRSASARAHAAAALLVAVTAGDGVIVRSLRST